MSNASFRSLPKTCPLLCSLSSSSRKLETNPASAAQSTIPLGLSPTLKTPATARNHHAFPQNNGQTKRSAMNLRCFSFARAWKPSFTTKPLPVRTPRPAILFLQTPPLQKSLANSTNSTRTIPPPSRTMPALSLSSILPPKASIVASSAKSSATFGASPTAPTQASATFSSPFTTKSQPPRGQDKNAMPQQKTLSNSSSAKPPQATPILSQHKKEKLWL